LNEFALAYDEAWLIVSHLSSEIEYLRCEQAEAVDYPKNSVKLRLKINLKEAFNE
jgi:hypothetical protein